MPGGLIAVLLIASLLLVHFSMRAQPMPRGRPLDVDDRLPLPEAGQASTVFSLTALFGAYFGIYLILGFPALLGLTSGTVVGLLTLRAWINRSHPRSFEAFLSGLLVGPRGNAAVFGLLLAAIQCAYATSELLILREVARVALGLRPEHATIVAMALAIIGYFYVLFGGYMAVFRTDVLQFVLVAAMGVVLLVLAPHGSILKDMIPRLPRAGYWQPQGFAPGLPLYLYQFVIAAVMGFGFLSASPDAWKRVYLVGRRKDKRRRFVVFLLAGTVPFLVLLPLAGRTPPIPDGPTNAGLLFAGLLTSNSLFIAAALGLIASFLSSFDSALLASVHVGLMMRRTEAPTKDEMPRFHWLMVTALLTTGFLFLGLVSLRNPYLLANVLLGPYAVIAGIQIGTRGSIAHLREGALLWIATFALLAWFGYLVSASSMTTTPTTYQINTVPSAVGLCLTVALVSWGVSFARRKR